MNTPPRPTTPPTNGATVGPQTVNRNRTGGGFNPSVSLGFTKVTQQGGGGVGQQAGAAGAAGGGKVPGSDFMSNEDIRAFCEHHRKKSRNGATELAMDADHLEAVLRTIPDTSGSRSGSRARSRRVTRWLKKAAAAQKAQQKYFASLYGAFEREFESELRTIGKGRAQPKPRQPFGWR
ncbi:plasmid transfer protein TraA [Streptomyces sp. NPDC001880]